VSEPADDKTESTANITTHTTTTKAYLDDLQTVWVECARVLRLNGKLCINAMMMPLPKEARPQQYTRRLEDIPGDIGRGIVEATDLERYDRFY
jgi:hypothetical protein